MPEVAMGTWAGSYKDCGAIDFTCVKQHARFAIDNWLHIGGRHVDGANDYRTQTVIAEALQGSGLKREDIFLTTKCPGTMGFEATIQCADDNLQMLSQFGTHGVAYIDLLLVHFPGTIKPVCRFQRDAPQCQNGQALVPGDKKALQDTWRAMEELKTLGVVKSIGVSDYSIQNLQDTLEIAKEKISVNQVEWNPLHHDDEMLEFCKKNGILLQAWSPLGGAEGSVMSDPIVKEVASKHNVSTAQIVLRWSLQQGVAVVVGTANPEHQMGDHDIFNFQLTEDEMKRISALKQGRNITTIAV
jgi:diketogulonate reductase-like aldo/keto reductase